MLGRAGLQVKLKHSNLRGDAGTYLRHSPTKR